MPMFKYVTEAATRRAAVSAPAIAPRPARRPNLWLIVPLAGVMMVAGCSTPKPEPKPQPPSTRPVPPPPPPATPPPASSNWEDWPYTPGGWSYRAEGQGSVALFGMGPQAPQFSIRCDKAARRIQLARPGFLEPGKSANMVIRATTGSAQYPLANAGGQPAQVAATLSPLDPILDKIAFSRGRFVVEVAGAPTPLVIPTWPEFARVVEDCR
ncbi:hypothetical protein [Pseudonocardia sp. TMWB2A]|uniref:hypothetical protein n=1 Tax=Pseudonocardia sp. TMWB2A TaxID=687430 RepID=UPI00307D5077